MVTTVSETFLSAIYQKPEVKSLDEFDLTITGPDGQSIPYIGYIEASVEANFMHGKEVMVPVLVMPSTEYNSEVPVIIGTNVIRLYQEMINEEDEIPSQWSNAFLTLQNGFAGLVRSTNKTNIQIQPMETVTISGFIRKGRDVETVVTEQTERASSKIGVCPRVVSLDKPGKNARIPVKIFNMSAKVLTLSPKSLLCQVLEVKVLHSWDPKLEKSNEVQAGQQTATTSDETQADQEHIRDDKNNAENRNDFNLSDIGVDLSDSNITENQKEKASTIFEKWQTIFSKSPIDLGHTDLVRHEINLTDETPFKDHYRRISPGLYDEIREHLSEMLAADAIRPSQSPFSSNVVVVRKKDGSIRLCIDFRKLNLRTVKDAYAIPRIEDSLHLLVGSKYFTKLDLKAGYWQVELKEEDKRKTAFQVGNLGFFECNRMPFGLCNAPATFQRLMERAMGDINLRDCLIYLDDIIIFSDSFDTHLDRLEAVFQRIHKYNLKLKASKCEFFQSQVTYLGHVVSEEGIKTDPEKIRVLKEWPVPKSVKDVRKFLGFTGYYRRFIKGFASVVRPLNDLLVGCSTKKGTKKKPTFKWEAAQQQAFESIIERLSNPPVLAYANYKLPFKLHTDASGSGLGAVLYQHQDDLDRVVAYASRSLKPAERNYPAHKLEFLALKWAITDKFHDYLYGTSFEVVTDNNPLTYILTSAKLDATGHRWVAGLSNYNFKITYRSGKLNKDADALSRLPESTESHSMLYPDVLKAILNTCQESNEESPLAESVLITNAPQIASLEPDIPQEQLKALALSSTDWNKGQADDPVITEVKDIVRGGQKPSAKTIKKENSSVRRYLRDWDKLILKEGVLYRKVTLDGQAYDQLVVPSSVRDIVLRALHDDMGHQGRDRTTSLIKARFFWIGMDADISKKVRRCGRCIRRKTRPVPAAELVNITSSYPMELVCMDYLSLETSRGGYDNILVITDHFTRYAQAIPTRNQTAYTTAKVLYENYFIHYGFPFKLHSDKAQNFESKVIRHLCKLAGIKKTRTTPYHPMGNGQVERFNQTLLQMLGTLDSSKKSDWKSYVSPLVHAYNATRHDSTGFSPFYLMFGRHPRLAIDAFLGLNTNSQTGTNQTEYVHKLQSRLAFAYNKAAEVSRKQGATYKRYYDTAVRENKLEVGDRVLIRLVGLKGKNKLADRWDEEPYTILRQPIPDVPVFDVQKEDGTGRVKTLHRNLLLPIGSLPYEQMINSEDEVDVSKGSNVSELSDSEENNELKTSSSSTDEDQSQQDEPTRPKTRNRAEPGLLPRSKPSRRQKRERRPPAWITSDNWVR